MCGPDADGEDGREGHEAGLERDGERIEGLEPAVARALLDTAPTGDARSVAASERLGDDPHDGHL